MAAAAGSSAGGSILPPTSPMALRVRKKKRLEEGKREEEEVEEQKEQDEDDEEVEEAPFRGEDIQDRLGELTRELLFWNTFDALRPPQESILTEYWTDRLKGKERGIMELRAKYNVCRRCVFPSIFTFLIHLFLFISPSFFLFFLTSSLLHPTHHPQHRRRKGGEAREIFEKIIAATAAP